jgi:hypothetical protein
LVIDFLQLQSLQRPFRFLGASLLLMTNLPIDTVTPTVAPAAESVLSVS